MEKEIFRKRVEYKDHYILVTVTQQKPLSCYRLVIKSSKKTVTAFLTDRKYKHQKEAIRDAKKALESFESLNLILNPVF